MAVAVAPLTSDQLQYVGTREGPHKRRSGPKLKPGDWLKQIVFAVREVQTEHGGFECYASVPAVLEKLALGVNASNSSAVRKAFVRLAHNYGFRYIPGALFGPSAAFIQFAQGITNGCRCRECRSDLHYGTC